MKTMARPPRSVVACGVPVDAWGDYSPRLRLRRLNEPCLLRNVRRRFERAQIYTHTGALELLALNPYVL